jgi:hypothetical protein
MNFYRPVSSEMRSYLSAKKKGDVRMKYLVTFNYNPTDIPELAKKAKEYDEDKKKNLSKVSRCKGVAILEGSALIQMANKFTCFLSLNILSYRLLMLEPS